MKFNFSLLYMKNLIALSFFIVISYVGATAQSWVLTSTFPDTYYPNDRNSGVYVIVGTKAYYGLGLISNDDGFGFLRDFWVYDIPANKWTKLANFPGHARYNAVAFAIGDKIYVGGGNIEFNAIEDEFGTYKRIRMNSAHQRRIMGRD